MTADPRSPEDPRLAAIERELERGLRAEGSAALIRAIAQLRIGLDRLEEGANRSGVRLSAVEAAVDALEIPLIGDLAKSREAPESVTVSAAMPLARADGFHMAEHPEAGDAYRWTGANGEEFAFTLVIDRSTELLARLVLIPQGPGMSPVPDMLDCVVDGQHFRAEADVSDRGTYEVRIPPREGGTFTKLSFATRTGQAEGDGDTRQVGVPFRYLTVESISE